MATHSAPPFLFADDSQLRQLSKSLAIHLLLLALFLYWQTREDTSDQASAPIEIQSITQRPAPSQTAKKQSRQATLQHPVAKGVSLDDLGMRFSYLAPQEYSNTPSDIPAPNESAHESTDEGGWDTLNPNPRISRFNQYIYRTVQGWLDRDAYRNTAKLIGTVRVRIWFDGDGNYLEDQTEYDAIDENFRRIVQRALHNSFLRPVPRPYLYTREKFSIVRRVVVMDH